MEFISARLEQRRRDFMQGCDPALQLDKSHQFSIELRKQHRSDQACKKRLSLAATREASFALNERLVGVFPVLREMRDMDRIHYLRDVLTTETDQDKVHVALQITVELIRWNKQDSVALEMLPIALRYMDGRGCPWDVVLQATNLMCALAAGSSEVAAGIVDCGGIEALWNVAHTEKVDIQELALWGMGNIAAECQEYRNILISKGVLDLISRLVLTVQSMGITLLKAAAWALSMLVYHPVNLTQFTFNSATKTAKTLLSYTDLEIKRDTLNALDGLTKQPKDFFPILLEENLLPVIIDTLTFAQNSIDFPVLNIIGNLTYSDNLYIDHLLSLDVLSKMQPFICNPDAKIRKEVMWTLGNIAAGTVEQAKQVLLHSICQDALVGFRDTGLKIALETSYLYRNLIGKLGLTAARRLVELKILSYLLVVFERKEPETVKNSLSILRDLLAARESTVSENPATRTVEETKCMEVLEKLHLGSNTDLSKTAEDLLDRYFGAVPDFEEVRVEQTPPVFQFS